MGTAAATCANVASRIREGTFLREQPTGRTQVEVIEGDPASSYSSAVQPWIDAIEDQSDFTQDVEEHHQRIDSVRTAALSVLADSIDIQMVTTLASVADSSAAYWRAEFEDWYETGLPDCDVPDPHPACGEPIPEAPARGPLSDFLAGGWRVLVADVAGGVVGGSIGGPGGIVPGAGAGSVVQASMEIVALFQQQ